MNTRRFNLSYFVKVGKKTILYSLFSIKISNERHHHMRMMIYLTHFDGQHKQCLVCSGILEAKCTLIGCVVDCTREDIQLEKEISDRIERESKQARERTSECVLMIIEFDNTD